MTITATWNDSPASPGYDIAISGLATALNSNSFFETSISPWTAINGATLSQSSAQFHEGTKSLQMTPDGVGSGPQCRSEAVTGVLPFVSYTHSVWIRSNVAISPVVGIIWRDNLGAVITSPNVVVPLTANTWTKVTFKATSPSNAAQANAFAGISGVPPNTTLLFLDESKLYVDYSYYTVTRQDLSGFLPDGVVRSPGAGPDGLVPTNDSDTAALSDYEFSFNTNIRYLLRKYNTSKQLVTSENVAVGFPPIPTTAYYGHAWLKDVLTPSNSQPIIIGEFNSYQRDTRVTLITVLGRQNPVPITDVLAGKSGSFTFYAMDTGFGGTIPTVDEYNVLLNEGQTLYLQSLSPQTVGWKDSYIVITSVEFERLSLPYSPSETIFKYTLGFAQVDEPLANSIDISLHTWQEVLDNHTDWQDVLSGHANWLDVYQDPANLN